MSISTHPFVKYGIATVLRENDLSGINDITRQHLIREIENSINHFRVKPENAINEQKSVNSSIAMKSQEIQTREYT